MLSKLFGSWSVHCWYYAVLSLFTIGSEKTLIFLGQRVFMAPFYNAAVFAWTTIGQSWLVGLTRLVFAQNKPKYFDAVIIRYIYSNQQKLQSNKNEL